jgi:spermidine synthase
VTVCELVPAIVDWNQRHVGALAGHPLSDPRNQVVLGDVFDHIRRSPRAFDAILLDVDNGPRALSSAANQRLYGERGIRTCLGALRPRGVLAVWSANPNSRFERNLVRAGFEVEVLRVSAFKSGHGKHVLFLGTAPPQTGRSPRADQRT